MTHYSLSLKAVQSSPGAAPSAGPGPSSPRPSYGNRVFAGDIDDDAHAEVNWDAQKEAAATGELPIGPRPSRL